MISANKDNYPLVSFCIMAYNAEKYIEEALMGAISQDYPNLEIIISDDASKDNTVCVVNNFISNYSGNLRIIFNVNERNLGIGGNINKLISLSHGSYIILCGGDDISLSNRTKESIKLLQETGKKCGGFAYSLIDKYSNDITTNHNNISLLPTYKNPYLLDDFLNNEYFPGTGPSKIIDRMLFEYFGPLNEDCPTEDSTLTLRALLYGGIVFNPKICVKYRIHSESTSSGNNILKIDCDSIYRQYYSDIELAQKNNLISDVQYNKLIKNINLYRIIESTKRRVFFSKSRFQKIFWITIFLFNKNIGLKKRTLKMAKKYLIGKYE